MTAATTPNPEPADPVKEAVRTTRQVICDAIQDLVQQHQVVTRQTLCDVTGLKLTLIDDHVSRMHDDGELRRLRPGVFAPIAPMPEPRAVSVTDHPDGTTLVEVGDFILRLWPHERRALGTRLAGDALQLSNMQAGHDVNFLVNEVWRELKKLKLDLGEA